MQIEETTVIFYLLSLSISPCNLFVMIPVMALKCRPKYFAERLVWCMKGLGTHDSDLIRVIVSRAEVCRIKKGLFMN